jgi:hypothetical protein
MSLMEQIYKDIHYITTNVDEWSSSIKFLRPPLYSTETTIKGVHTKIHLGVDADGVPVNSKQARLMVSEKTFVDASYSIRNNKGDVDLKNHRVRVKDSTGVEYTYQIREWFEDETIGLITIQLKDLI